MKLTSWSRIIELGVIAIGAIATAHPEIPQPEHE